MDDIFVLLNSVDVSKKVEKKQNLSYLSWAWAWGEFKKVCPFGNYHIYENKDGLNYHHDGKTAWVKVGVSSDPTKPETEHIEMLPVMDFRNDSIPVGEITSFDVNKAIQRALTKAIARHGLGLYIYAGEDLPEDSKASKAQEFSKPKAVSQPLAAPKATAAPAHAPKPEPKDEPEMAEQASDEPSGESESHSESQESEAKPEFHNTPTYTGVVDDVKKNAAKGTFIISMDNGKKYYTKSEEVAVAARDLIESKACLSYEDKGAYMIATGILAVVKEQ